MKRSKNILMAETIIKIILVAILGFLAAFLWAFHKNVVLTPDNVKTLISCGLILLLFYSLSNIAENDKN